MENTAYGRAKEYEKKVKDAAAQILALSDKLHLTWAEFEAAIQLVKKKAVLTTPDF